MADIDEIISGVRGNTKYDFAALGDPVKSFFDASKQRAEFDQRRAFKDGVPTDENGQPDFGAMSKAYFEKGDVANGIATSNLDLQRQNLKFGQGQSAAISNFEGGQPAQAPQAPIVSPPSSSRSASAVVMPPLNKGGVVPQGQPSGRGSPQGDQPGSIVGVVSAAGIPDELAGPVIAQISALTKMDPNAALPPEVSQRVQQVVQAAAQRMKASQPQQPTGPAPQPVQVAQGAPPAQPAPVTDRVTTSAPPTVPSQVDKAIAFYSGIMSNPNSPKQNVELAKVRLEALQKSAELTPEQKNYAQAVTQGFKGTMQDYQSAIEAQKVQAENEKLTPTQREYAQAKKEGFKGTLEDYLNRTDENTTQRDILSKSLLPKLDKSQESATAARDDIDSIHRAREELDKTGGIISGSFAEKRLQLAKLASFLGVQNADKINNTESYMAAVGQRVAAMVKAFGSGTAISDGDRRFASEMAGGRIALDEGSMRRILDIGERAARGKIDNHNKLVDNTINANEALKPARDSYVVNAPGSYKKAAAPDAYEKARDALSKGAPRDAVIQRLQKAGFDPSKL